MKMKLKLILATLDKIRKDAIETNNTSVVVRVNQLKSTTEDLIFNIDEFEKKTKRLAVTL